MNTASLPARANPWTAWIALALDTTTMLTAAASVIGNRTARIQAAGAMPSADDRQELALMVQEKLDAAYHCWQAMLHRLLATSGQLAVSGYEQAVALSSAMQALTISPTPVQALALQAQAARAVEQWIQCGSRITDATASIADAGLKSIHATVSANVERLGKS